jgi:diaminopimelate epimerase
MRIALTKHHGWGNDFLVADDDQLPPALDLPAVARQLCDRHRGVGADGLLVIGAAEGYDAVMTLYNADGSVAEMSGNGIRCFAQAVARRRGHLGVQHILTGAGPRQVTLVATDRHDTIEASVGMGSVSSIAAPDGWDSIGAHPDRPVMHLGVGNPHTVVGVDDVLAVDLLALGRAVPGTNLEIVEPGPEPHGVTMRVHERGAGLTAACGTGACATAWAAVSWGLVPAAAAEILVHMDGGSAKVRLHDPVAGQVTLIGPAVYVASITVDIDPDDVAARPTP